ncbi:High-affinity nicotinic acid transporter [Saxophila tyrrhenica]|uniref:High-affinity nicotinic acid transporter n=1 Tax=Saxophila tyrrhenica TaxID=1690608 RepID=A0AAV9PDB8_9PEZI|nr:High-affinity nicotinic acid transporter [Saxophila tyrrhenica]
MRFYNNEKTETVSDYPPEDGYAGDAYSPNGDSDSEVVQCPPHTTERKLLMRIDLHVIPFLCIMYLLAFLDRINIGNANVFGLSEELGLEEGNK